MNEFQRDDSAEADRHRLFSAALDDRLEAGEAERLSNLLRTDAEARQLWFLYHDIDCGLTEPRPLPAAAAPRPTKAARFQGRLLAAAAACILFGMCCGSAVFAYFVPGFDKPLMLLSESFEEAAPPESSGVPDQAGVWGGDFSELAEAQQGIAPASGRRMLRFLRGDHEGLRLSESFGSDVFRLVDVRPYRDEIVAGDAVVQLTAYFNAAATERAEPAASTLTIFALDARLVGRGELKADRALSQESLAYSRSSRVTLDADPASWQRGTNELRLPPNTEYLMIRLGVSNSPRGTKRRADDFAEHYADQVQLHLARRPEIARP